MRELKFRVYIPEHEKLCYFALGNFDYSDRYLQQHAYPVQQFTGLKDRNGVEVYEGDIITFRPVSNKPPFYEVRYDLERGCFLPYHTKHEYFVETDDDYPKFLYSENIRVIGNKFENPELFTKIKLIQ